MDGLEVDVKMDVGKRIRKFNAQADLYDKKRNRNELGWLRSRLLQAARGRVLEIGFGAGGNLPYYPKDIELVAVDFSPAMLEKAKQANDRLYQLKVTYVEGDVEDVTLPEQSFDTVVSTLSLCAVPHPDRVLARLGRWCKPEGQVLLMEHGRSSNRVLALAQNVLDPLLYRWVGCHHDRDFPALVEAAPLQIIRSERHMAGILQLYWCRPLPVDRE